MRKRFAYVGNYTVTQHKDGTASVSCDVDGDEVIIARCDDWPSAVSTAWVVTGHDGVDGWEVAA
jgi:hypothetical protein